MLAAVLPVHLAAVVVELSVGSAREAGDPPAAGVAVLCRLTMASCHGDNAASGKKEEKKELK